MSCSAITLYDELSGEPLMTGFYASAVDALYEAAAQKTFNGRWVGRTVLARQASGPERVRLLRDCAPLLGAVEGEDSPFDDEAIFRSVVHFWCPQDRPNREQK